VADNLHTSDTVHKLYIKLISAGLLCMVTLMFDWLIILAVKLLHWKSG